MGKAAMVLLLLLSSASLFSQKHYPDFRKVCAYSLNNDIIMNWSPLTDPCGKFIGLYIYGRVDAVQPFKLIDSIKNINASTYTHAGAKAISTNWNYYLVYKFDCSNDSAVSDTLFIDFTQPGTSTIDSVSVDINTGYVVVGWSPNSATDLMSYVIWYNKGANNIPRDTIVPTTFTDSTAAPAGGSISYTLTALDSCYNQSVISDVHKTMFLSSVYDSCNYKINLSWTPYIGWAGIAKYEINGKNGTSPFSIVGSTPGTQTFTFNSFTPGDTLEFYIRAYAQGSGFTSSSNRIRIVTRKRVFPTNNYISYVTVADSSRIEIKFLGDTLSDTKKFYIYRSEENNSFQKISETPVIPGASFYFYQDHDVTPTTLYYKYRIITYDGCNNILDTSDVERSILLSLNSDETGNNNLTWNKYINWDAGVQQYSVYRGFDFGSGFTWNLLSTVSNSDSIYLDNNVPVETGNSGTCYYIEAEEAAGNKYGEQAKSKSNIVCSNEDVTIFFPNAFAPEKVNTHFLPKGTGIDYKKSSMRIYARNGQFVKEIKDIREGWDGRDDEGNIYIQGVYLYLCEIYGLNGKKSNFKGTVTLLR